MQRQVWYIGLAVLLVAITMTFEQHRYGGARPCRHGGRAAGGCLTGGFGPDRHYTRFSRAIGRAMRAAWMSQLRWLSGLRVRPWPWAATMGMGRPC